MEAHTTHTEVPSTPSIPSGVLLPGPLGSLVEGGLLVATLLAILRVGWKFVVKKDEVESRLIGDLVDDLRKNQAKFLEDSHETQTHSQETQTQLLQQLREQQASFLALEKEFLETMQTIQEALRSEHAIHMGVEPSVHSRNFQALERIEQTLEHCVQLLTRLQELQLEISGAMKIFGHVLHPQPESSGSS